MRKINEITGKAYAPWKTKHGEFVRHNKRTKEYRTWCRMKERCLNKNNPSYAYYGVRGIKICDRWLDSYANFLHDLGRAPSPKHSLERINVEGNYEPLNCKWATVFEQNNNQLKTIRLLYNGQLKALRYWCIELGIDYTATKERIRNGWSPERAFETPVKHHKKSG